MKATTTDIFFQLLRISAGTCKPDAFPHDVSMEEWLAVYSMAQKQSLLGVVEAAIEMLPAELVPNSPALRKVCAIVESARRKNIRQYEALSSVLEQFKAGGFEKVLLLKGQGLAALYPMPEKRMPGDLDIWVDAPRAAVIDFCRKGNPGADASYHHIDAAKVDKMEVEAHFTPSWMHDPFLNLRLQRWFKAQSAVQFSHRTSLGGMEICVPTLEFNRVYVLLHIFRHLFREGIGLRQLMDYFFVLRQGFTEEEKASTMAVLKSLKIDKFCAATMYVLSVVFGLDSEHMLCVPDKKRGEFLLSEVMLAGNFGRYDSRYRCFSSNPLKRFIQTVLKDLRFIRQYPREVIWAPGFKIWHWFWRHNHNRK